ncbi:MAG: helix-turn-helix domain-containing protein [Thermomicrobiales bacterium]|nr:helix-turn-helix domain-containing protein [Thermomicrobiales bacterium]
MSDDMRIDEPPVGHRWELLHREEYTPEEAAEVLNMHASHLLKAAFGGDLKAEIINGDVISIRRSDLVAWLQWREQH